MMTITLWVAVAVAVAAFANSVVSWRRRARSRQQVIARLRRLTLLDRLR